MSDFVVPDKQRPRDRYSALPVSSNAGSGWPHVTVTVIDETGKTIAEYGRNYSFLRTFEPFRQYRDGVWRDYALISRTYTKLEVLDLSTGKVIAEEPPPRIDKDWQDGILKYATDKDEALEKYPIGKEMPGAGFCPVEFYVPDWHDVHDDDDGSIRPGNKYWESGDELPVGDFGVYAGCVWGDDTSWKIRYVDLSRIAEGHVTTDERFGYVELPQQLKLRQAVRYDSESDVVHLAVNTYFNRATGRAGAWVRNGINWEKETGHGQPATDG